MPIHVHRCRRTEKLGVIQAWHGAAWINVLRTMKLSLSETGMHIIATATATKSPMPEHRNHILK